MFDDHAGDVIYRVPRRFPELARVVETSRVREQAGGPALEAYAQALEKGPDSRALMEWDGIEAIRIRATIAEGQSVVVQMAYDPQWRAESSGAALTTRKDALGQMLIEAPPGLHDMRLKFETPLENRIGRLISLFFAIAVLGLMIYR